MNDKLIYGKSEIQRIVGIECVDGNAELFIQELDGNITSKFVPNKYWILSNEKLDKRAARLEGDLYYKWGYIFDDRKTFQKMRSIWKNQGHDIYSIWNAEEACMAKDGHTMYKGLKHTDLSLLSFDIETTGLDPYASDAKLLLVSMTYRAHNGAISKYLLAYDDYFNDLEFITDINQIVKDLDPSLIIGHNIIPYDLMYLNAIAEKAGTKLHWGRDGSAVEFENIDSKLRLDGTRELLYKRAKIYGREIVDTFFLAINFDVSKSMESYGLKPLIKQLGFEKEGRMFYDASQIRYKYKDPNEWEQIKQYCVDDSDDPIKLFDMMFPLYFNMAPMIPKPMTEILLTASGSKINALLVRAYLQDKHSIPKADPPQKYSGALSFAVPGIYSNCFKIDLAALYPSIMLQFEVYDQDKDPKAYLLQLVKIFRTKRLEYKRLAQETGDKLYQEMDVTAKSILNSFYGALGANGLQFNSFECADFITSKGREILEYTIKWASGKELAEFMPEEETNEEETA